MRLIVLAVFFGYSAFAAASDGSKPLRIVADEWCPVTCSAQSDKRGYAVDIMEAALRAEGFQTTYETIPWAEALKGTKDGTFDIVLGATEGELNEAIRPDEEIGFSVNAFFTRDSDSWRYKDIQSLKNKTLIVVDGYAYGNPLDGYIEKYGSDKKRVRVVDSASPVRSALQSLKSHRADIYIEDRVVFRWNLVRSLQGGIREAGEYSRRPLLALFSEKNTRSRQIASAFDQRMQSMRRSGELKRILHRYGMEDWK